MLLLWILVVVMPLLTAACAPSAQRCSCHHVQLSTGMIGCFIDGAAPAGFKCACKQVRNKHLRCNGEVHPCRNDEACPGGQYSYCSCVQGGGDCWGYPLRPPTLESCATVNKVERSSSLRQYSYQDCECDYYSNYDYWGCRIVEPAPEGFKCLCYYDRLYTCHGYSVGCDQDEYCPADDYTYCGCLRGGGNCDGYRYDDRDQVCGLGSTCDCDRSSDWTKGRYTIDDVTFNTDNRKRINARPILSEPIDVENASDLEQSKDKTMEQTLTTESSFERNHGITVAVGLPFKIKSGTISLTLSTTNTFTYGTKTTTSKKYSHTYKCKSQPKTHTQCKVILFSSDEIIPYTMFLKHNVIPDCVCRSFGKFWVSGVFYSRMKVEIIGPCHSFVNGTCAKIMLQ